MKTRFGWDGRESKVLIRGCFEDKLFLCHYQDQWLRSQKRNICQLKVEAVLDLHFPNRPPRRSKVTHSVRTMCFIQTLMCKPQQIANLNGTLTTYSIRNWFSRARLLPKRETQFQVGTLPFLEHLLQDAAMWARGLQVGIVDKATVTFVSRLIRVECWPFRRIKQTVL